jgi:hypothetical protein
MVATHPAPVQEAGLVSRGRTLAETALVFVACTALLYAMLTQRPSLVDADGLFHFKVARLILAQGPWVDISWLPYTVLGDHGTDHQWLFHVLIAPFTLLGDDFRAVSLTAAMMGALIPAAFVPMLRAARVPHAALFCVAMVFCGELLPARFGMLRAQNVAVILMAAALFAVLAQRAAWAGVVAFLFMQSYHAAVILAVVAVTGMAAVYLTERTLNARTFVAILVGIFAGLLASPWFPENVGYLVFHTFFKAATGYAGLVGTEWYRVPLAVMASESWPAHVLLLSGLAAAAAAWRKPGHPRLAASTLAFLAITAVFLAMYHFAWRFVEYYAPFAVVTAGLLWRDALQAREPGIAVRVAIPVCLVAIIAWVGVQGAARIREARQSSFDAYADMMRYVDANDERPMVFNSRWSDFVRLFYWSERARFVSGLDGHYLLYGDEKRFKVWYEVSTGATLGRADNATLIRETFGAGWAVIPRNQRPIAMAIARDPTATIVMETRDGWLLRLGQGGAAPALAR